MKYKVGDNVRINISSYNKEDTNSISSRLLNIYEKFNGQLATITKVYENLQQYLIDLDNSEHIWFDEMLEPVNDEEMLELVRDLKVVFYQIENIIISRIVQFPNHLNKYINENDLLFKLSGSNMSFRLCITYSYNHSYYYALKSKQGNIIDIKFCISNSDSYSALQLDSKDQADLVLAGLKQLVRNFNKSRHKEKIETDNEGIKLFGEIVQ